LGLALLLLLARLIITRQTLPAAPANPAILVLLVMILLSTQISVVPQNTYPAAGQTLLGVLLFFCAARLGQQPAQMRTLLVVLLLAGLSLASIAPLVVNWSLQSITVTPQVLSEANIFGRIWLRVMAIFTPLVTNLPEAFKNDPVNFNVMAGTILVLLAGCLGYLVYDWPSAGPWKKTGLAVSAIWMATALLFSLSRGALAALVVVIILLGGLRLHTSRRLLPLIFIVFIATTALALANTQRIIDFMSVKGSPNTSYEGRIEIWSRAVYLIQKFPLSGVGLGAFGEAADALAPFQLFKPGTVEHSHNLFLQVALDLGLPGLLAWLALVWIALRIAWKLYRGANPALGAALLCIHVALGVHGLWDAVTWSTRPSVLVWLIWGLTIAAWKVYLLPESPPTLAA
jgi:putative inorganic carbon (HCO3(-)) transporter